MAEENHIEHDKQQAVKPASRRKKFAIWGALLLVAAGGIGGAAYWYVSSKTVYIDQSVIEAPLVNLSPTAAGVLEEVYVNVGDNISANAPVARVGDQIVKSKTAGLIVSVNQNIGQLVNPAAGGTVASMIDPSDLRVVGHLEETKGLADVHVGDPAVFTVDAFGSKQFKGVVDEVSPTSRQSDVVFNISDKRPTNEFDVKVRFDPSQYPELKNGMSARIWVFKQ